MYLQQFLNAWQCLYVCICFKYLSLRLEHKNSGDIQKTVSVPLRSDFSHRLSNSHCAVHELLLRVSGTRQWKFPASAITEMSRINSVLS